MRFNTNILDTYLTNAPAPLALERTWECEIYKHLDFVRPILDLGCGDGIFVKTLFREKIDVGLEPLGFELEYAKTLDVFEELVHANGDNIPKPDNTFGTVYSNSVMEHIPDIEPVIAEVFRVLKPGGKLYVTLPTDRFDKYTFANMFLTLLPSLQHAYRRFFNRFWKHYHYYDREGWIRLFEMSGFKCVQVQEYGKKGQCMLNDFMVPFTIPSFVAKKLLNRHFVFPGLRKKISPVLARILGSQKKIFPELETGGLIFLAFER